jgi:hypothetical protein
VAPQQRQVSADRRGGGPHARGRARPAAAVAAAVAAVGAPAGLLAAAAAGAAATQVDGRGTQAEDDERQHGCRLNQESRTPAQGATHEAARDVAKGIACIAWGGSTEYTVAAADRRSCQWAGRLARSWD